jgi:plasmid segregation protein ParM
MEEKTVTQSHPTTAIALDIGRSATKVVAMWRKGKSWERTEMVFPSAVVPARKLYDERAAREATKETVVVDDHVYWIGSTALNQGNDQMVGSLRDDWMLSPEHNALLMGALVKLKAAGVPAVDHARIGVGLPAKLYTTIQHDKLGQSLRRVVPDATIHVMNQPSGPLYERMFDDRGNQSDFDPDQEIWAVLEVGQYTSDVALQRMGQTIQDNCGSTVGMAAVAANLQRVLQERPFEINDVSLAEATAALASGTITVAGKQVEVQEAIQKALRPVAEEIMQEAERLLGSGTTRQMHGIIIAGGGAPLIYPYAHQRWPQAILAPNSRFSVAEGFARILAAKINLTSSAADNSNAE